MEHLYEYDPDLKIEPDHYSGGIPVFKPSHEEFKDFYKFNKAINEYGMQSGIVKVVPPKQWLKTLTSNYTKQNLEQIKIKNPIIQNINSSGNGVFSQQNVERSRSYSIFQWKELSEKSNYQPPAPKGEVRNGMNKDKNTSPSKRPSKFSKSDYDIDVSKFDEKRCEQLERTYWKSLTYAEPMYGADLMGSLFSKSIKNWNVAKLPNVLDLMDVKLPGVNDAYLYAGLWKATFAWHLEDQDLYSINYLHFGAPKQWYSIPQDESEHFFNVMKDTFPEEYSNCHDFLRHKTFLVSPQFLEKHNVRYNKIVHYPEEFIITYPFGYHAGFNYGYNLAESVNFALDEWFPYGSNSSKCECISDSVGINVKQIYCKFKGIPYEVPDLTSDDGHEEEAEEVEEHTQMVHKINSFSKKDKKHQSIGNNNKKHEKGKIQSLKSTKKSEKPQSKNLIKSETKHETKAESNVSPLIDYSDDYECFLCPNNLSDKLLHLKQFELLETDRKKPSGEVIKVHRFCCELFSRELSIKKDKVFGLHQLSSAQQNLKCVKCNKKIKHGANFQCTYKKCVRAYHGTCALKDGVLFNFKDNEYNCKYHTRGFRSNSDVQPEDLCTDSLIPVTVKRDHLTGLVESNDSFAKTIEVLIYPELTELKTIHYNDLLRDSDGSLAVDPFFINNLEVLGIKSANTKLYTTRNLVVETLQDNFRSKFKEIWYNLPEHSDDQMARYTNDITITQPNDPVSVKQQERKRKKYKKLKTDNSASNNTITNEHQQNSMNNNALPVYGYPQMAVFHHGMSQSIPRGSHLHPSQVPGGPSSYPPAMSNPNTVQMPPIPPPMSNIVPSSQPSGYLFAVDPRSNPSLVQ